MVLERYRKKRDFKKTAEPRGARKTSRRASGLGFVVQKHDASRLHYDFRLELDGVLKSWACPKGPSLDPGEKRLAVQVEDHPIEYADFEGVIPKGQYGGGTVLVWDRGTWEPEDGMDPARALEKGTLKFRLEGEKLKGSWTLVRFHGRKDTKDHDERNWLLIKHQDAEARTGSGDEITRERTESVISGGDLESVAGKRNGRVWSSDRAPANGKHSRKPRPTTRLDPASIEGARKAKLGGWIEPQLATLVQVVPAGDEWLHETKFDGYRAFARVSKGKVRWFTRQGKDWTAKFASLSPALAALPVREALFDGEIVVLAPDGTTSFQDLQQAFREKPSELTYCIFDLLHLDGFDLRGAPLHARKQALAALVNAAGGESHLRYSDHVEGQGGRMLQAACKLGLEGVVSKRRDGTYRSGRGESWVKTKCNQQQELVIGGFSAPSGARQHFGALLLGYFVRGKLHFAGRVGTGFDDASLATLRAKLRALETDTPAFVDPPKGVEARGVKWVKPELVAAIQFTAWTTDGKLRHPSFQGLREDKPAREVVREKPAPAPHSAPSKTRAKTASSPRAKTAESTVAASPKGSVSVAGVAITHPERVLFTGSEATKLDVARYYESVAKWILPHVSDRPLNLLRCPSGSSKPCFFQRHGHDTFSAPVKSVSIGKGENAISVDSIAGVVTLVQMGVLEIHPWGARLGHLDHPDRLFFDLDPDPAVPWGRVVETAKLLRGLLRELGLESFVKTTGGKGLHVVVPLASRQGWDEVKSFSRGLAEQLVRAAPDLYIATASKARRTGKVFIDYLRNSRSASAVAAYSTRARAGGTVSVPISWKELEHAHNEDFTLATMPRRLKQLAKQDPWKGFFDLEQEIRAQALRSVTARARA